MDKNPSSLLSLAARKLFERQFCTFKKLPSHTQRMIAMKLVRVFRIEADQLTVDLLNLEYELRSHLQSKNDEIATTLNSIMHTWMREVRHAHSRLVGLHLSMTLRHRIQHDYRCLVYFRECSQCIREDMPFFKNEAVHRDPGEFLFSRFAISFHRKYRPLPPDSDSGSTSTSTSSSSEED